MKVLELFAGMRSISKAFEKRGHECFTIDWDRDLRGLSWYEDIMKVDKQDIINRFGKPDVIWASPDCTTYSIAGISHHRIKGINGELLPMSPYAKFCDELNKHVIRLIRQLEPELWFIENPRGGMRKMHFMQDFPRYTVTYCQYGDVRMKPTDIWTNHPDPHFKPMCHNGDPCHQKAPRGSRTGTQGLANHYERSRIPELLCEHIVDICESYMQNRP